MGQLEEFRRDRTQVVIRDVNVREEVAIAGKKRRGEQCQRDVCPEEVVSGCDLNGGSSVLHSKGLFVEIL